MSEHTELQDSLTGADIGKWVEFASHNGAEQGRIKSFNDKWIFVVFHCADNWDDFRNYTAAACAPESITFIEPPAIENAKPKAGQEGSHE